jgi:hypothetical protein
MQAEGRVDLLSERPALIRCGQLVIGGTDSATA